MKRKYKIILCVFVITALLSNFLLICSASSLDDPSSPDFSQPTYKAQIPFGQSAGTYIKPGEIFENFSGEVFVYNNQEGTVPPERFQVTLEETSLAGWDYHINYDTESDIQGEFLSLYWMPFRNMFYSEFETDIEIEFRFNFKYAYYCYANGYETIKELATSMACYVSGIKSTHYTLYYNTDGERFPLRAFAPDNSPTNHIDTNTQLDMPYDPNGYFSIVFSLPETVNPKTTSTMFLYITPRNYIILENKGAIENGTIDDILDNEDKFEVDLNQTLDKIDFSKPTIDNENLNILSLSSLHFIFDPSSGLYVHLLSIGVMTITIGTIGYIVHGKR